MTVGQTGDAITATVKVAAQPTAVTMAGGRVLVTSSNLDANFVPIGNGIVTAIDPKTMQVLGTATDGRHQLDRCGGRPRRPALRRQHRRLRRAGQPDDRESGDDGGRDDDPEHGRRSRRDQHRRERPRVHLELLRRHDRLEHRRRARSSRGPDNPVCAKIGDRHVPRRVRRDDERGRQPLSGVLRQRVAGPAAVRLRVQAGARSR